VAPRRHASSVAQCQVAERCAVGA